jgi:hypothetical protein
VKVKELTGDVTDTGESQRTYSSIVHYRKPYPSVFTWWEMSTINISFTRAPTNEFGLKNITLYTFVKKEVTKTCYQLVTYHYLSLEFNMSNATGVTCEQVLLTFHMQLNSSPVLSRVHIVQSV